MRVVRADSGFCVSELLRLWESLRLKFVVVARLSQPLQRVIRKETTWAATEVAGTEVAEVDHRGGRLAGGHAADPDPASGERESGAGRAARCCLIVRAICIRRW